MVAFNGLQLRLDGFNERPGKVGFLCASHCNHHPLGVSVWR